MRKKEFSFLSWFWRFSFSLAARESEGASPEPCYELLTYRQMDGFCYAEVLGGADFIASAGGVPFAPQEWPELSGAGSYTVDGVEYMYRYWTVDGDRIPRVNGNQS